MVSNISKLLVICLIHSNSAFQFKQSSKNSIASHVYRPKSLLTKILSTQESNFPVISKPKFGHNFINFIPKNSIPWRRVTTMFQALIASLVLLSLRVSSGIARAADGAIKGWDLFGRVPNDDWLFSNWRLTDPNLFKRSLTETVRYTTII